ncbi:hypothetical protein GGH19_004185 [Coemansia sp. RSA 1807]|nr:hypothetical protein IW142_003764 [Coemansia sp. RSA 564]KAJ2277359.1 hypothetical protein EV176_002117 [Coemansia sp. RSA 451]KAJ2405953.1 hypothetical protein J3F80_003815 [Coemansia sp. RSA 2526]KAJ2440408.1 hypothetical protein IWW46_003996 [Coemansia sp. RSA 2440]KAJ2555362.1 hypothetical protein IWW35_000746 [Coemansia sp. RSA 1878]KAJ2573961.1 hypothetical protein GGH19_004185 [Coemansia sp. RSA 1807]
MTAKPHSVDLSEFFTEATRVRDNSPLKSLTKYMEADPTLLSLGAGLPHPSTFPFAQIGAHVAPAGASVANTAPADMLNVSVTTSSGAIEGLGKFLQYGNGRGVPSYAAFTREHTHRVHDPKYVDWDTVVSLGNTDAFVKALMLFYTSGDTLLVDEWTYPAIIGTVVPMNIQLAPVRMDAEGMVPEALDHVCTNWTGERKLRMVYTIPTAQNPTGATMSIARKRAIYAVAQKHNLVIIEDDPYYYLQFEPYTADSENRYTNLPGITSLVPSLLSLDTDGRVIRLDSFSKVLAPGLRCGWVTAPKYITDKIQFHNETSIQQPAGVSQAIVASLMNEQWGHSGWERHLVQIQRDYAMRRDLFVDLCLKHLNGLVEFTVPDAGMFLWFRVQLKPELQGQTGVMQRVFDSMVANHVLLVPGYMFSPKGAEQKVRDEPYIRAAFSFAATTDFEAAITRLAQALEPFC